MFGVIAPFNFPVALALGMMSAALVAGNTVVFKPSDAAGLTGRLVVEVLVEGGVPDGVLNLVFGADEPGRALVNHPGVDGFAFTGSNFSAISLEPFAKGAGFAASLQASLTTILSAFLGAAVSARFDGTTWPLTIGFLCFGLAGLAATVPAAAPSATSRCSRGRGSSWPPTAG